MYCRSCSVNNVTKDNRDIPNQKYCMYCGYQWTKPTDPGPLECVFCHNDMPLAQPPGVFCPFCGWNQLNEVPKDIHPKLIEIAATYNPERVATFCLEILGLPINIVSKIARARRLNPVTILTMSEEKLLQIKQVGPQFAARIIKARTDWKPKE